MDRNGYNPSVICSNHEQCWVCGKGGELARHEIFGGNAFRKKSKRLGLWVSVCHNCHHKIHNDGEMMRHTRMAAQVIAMGTFHWNEDDFRREFGKSYLGKDEANAT